MEQLYDILAQITDIHTNMKDMIQILGLLKSNVEIKMNDEARGYIRLILRWMKSLEKDTLTVVDLLDVIMTEN